LLCCPYLPRLIAKGHQYCRRRCTSEGRAASTNTVSAVPEVEGGGVRFAVLEAGPIGYKPLTAKEGRQSSRIAIVMLLFVTHLMLVRSALDFFVCRPIAPTTTCSEYLMYLEVDPNVRCWKGSHFGWSMGLAVPMLLFYGIGIPLGAFVILFWRRKKLEEERCRLVYGFM
jgi:hypothetical protein